MVSILIEDMILDLGHEVVGPAAQLDDALTLAREADFDTALLDINLGGLLTYPVAELLEARAIPFVFITGYGAGALPENFRSHPTLQKPFTQKDLKAALNSHSPRSME